MFRDYVPYEQCYVGELLQSHLLSNKFWFVYMQNPPADFDTHTTNFEEAKRYALSVILLEGTVR